MRGARWERAAAAYARLALGAAFLSGVASRFGLWGRHVGYGTWENFVRYTAQVNALCASKAAGLSAGRLRSGGSAAKQRRTRRLLPRKSRSRPR